MFVYCRFLLLFHVYLFLRHSTIMWHTEQLKYFYSVWMLLGRILFVSILIIFVNGKLIKVRESIMNVNFMVGKKCAVACRTVYSSEIVKSDIYYCFVTFKAKHCRRYLNNGSQLRSSHLFIGNIYFRFIQWMRATQLIIVYNIQLLHRILVSS